MTDITKTINELNVFANKHKLILEDNGEVGFGRPCVGFISKGGNYLDYNPYSHPDYEPIWERDERLEPPKDVTDAYHKHDCFAVLVHNENHEDALRQLLLWVKHLEKQGELEVVEHNTGAEGVQAILSGVIGYSLRFKDTINEDQN